MSFFYVKKNKFNKYISMSKKYWYAPHKKEAYGDDEINAVTQCLHDGWLAGFGPKSIEFEKRVSTLFGKKHGLFVNSGSSAILLGLHSLQLTAGDEVVTPACTFATSVAPIIQCGLTPVFCDVELGTYVSTPDQVCEKIFIRELYRLNLYNKLKKKVN